MQRFPGPRVPFPQWQQGMDPNREVGKSRAAVQFPAGTQGLRPRQQTIGPRQSLLQYNQDLQAVKCTSNTQVVNNGIEISSHKQKKKTRQAAHSHQQAFRQYYQAQPQDSSQINQQQNSLRSHQFKMKKRQPSNLKSDSNPNINNWIVSDQPQMIRSGSNHDIQTNKSGPFMQNNSDPFIQKNSGPFIQNNIGPLMQNNCVPFVQNNSGPFVQNNSGPFMQNDSGPFLQNKSGPSMQNTNSGQLLQNNNSGQLQQNNIRSQFMQNNNIPFKRSYNCVQSNWNQLETGQNKPDSDIEILNPTPFKSRENQQNTDKVSPFKHTFGSNSSWQASGNTQGHVSGNILKKKYKKPKSFAFKQQQKILKLQKELSGKNIEMSRFTQEVAELKEKTAEVMKGNKHLVDVIKKKDLELESNKTLMIDMKAEIKRAQKEVLNCLQKSVAKSQEALKMDPAQTNKKTNIEVQNLTDNEVGKFQKDVADDPSSSLCLKIQNFLEFNGLAQKISTSIEKVLDIEDKSVMSNLKLGRLDVESAISAFQDNVLLLFDEVTSVIQKKVEVERSLADIEKKIEQKQVKLKKTTTNIEALLKKVKTLSKKDLKTSVEAHGLRGELESVKTELDQLDKHHRKLEIDNKRVVNKLNVITSNLDLNIEIL